MSHEKHDHNEAQAAQTGAKQTDAGTDAPLNGGEHIAAGSYTVLIQVKDAVGKQTAETRATFTVE